MAFPYREGEISQLRLFSLPLSQTAVQNIYYQDILPISSEGDSTSWLFNIPKQDYFYFYPKGTTLHVKCKVKRDDGSDCLSTDEYVPINLLLQTFWKQIIVSLQTVQVSTSTGNFAYHSYLRSILNIQESDKEKLMAQFYSRDNYSFDSVGIRTSEGGELIVNNAGMALRYVWAAKSKLIDIQGTLLDDFFQIDRFILPGVPISVQMERNDDKFCITSKDSLNVKLVIDSIQLRVCMVQVAPAIYLAHKEALNRSPAYYPMSKTDLVTKVISSGLSTLVWQDINGPFLPRRIVFALVEEKRYVGKRSLNPFKLGLFNIKSLGLTLNDKYISHKPYTLDQGGEEYVTPYIDLINIFPLNTLNKKDWSRGYSLFAYNVTDIVCTENDSCLSIPQRGTLGLEIYFKNALTENVMCIAWLEYQSIISIDQYKRVAVS